MCSMAGQADDTRIGSHPIGLLPIPDSAGERTEPSEPREADESGEPIGSTPDDDEKSGSDWPTGDAGTAPTLGLAISSATRLSAAMMIDGSGQSPTWVAELMRAPAVAASERPDCRAADTGRDGDLVSERHRSSHSSVVPPQPRTYARKHRQVGKRGTNLGSLDDVIRVVRTRGELGMIEPGAVPELAQLTQKSRRVVSRRRVARHLSYICLSVLHPGTPPLESVCRLDPWVHPRHGAHPPARIPPQVIACACAGRRNRGL